MVSSGITGSNQLLMNMDVEKSSIQGKKTSGLDFQAVMSARTSENKSTDSNSISDSTKHQTNNVDNNDSKVSQKDRTDVDKTTKNDDVENELDEKIADTIKTIRDKIKDVLSISDEELDDLLASLGMTMTDLLKTNSIVEIVMKNSGQEGALALITDSQSSNQLKQLLNFVGQQLTQLSQETGMDVSELQQLADDEIQVDTAFMNMLTNKLDIKTDEISKQQNMDDNQSQLTNVVNQSTQSEDTTDEAKDEIASKITVENHQTVDANAKTASDDNKDAQGRSSEDNATMTSNSKAEDNSLNGVVNNLVNSFEQALNIQEEGLSQVESANVVRQIVDAAKIIVRDSLQTMELQLNPENLGKVGLTVSTKEGVVSAQITAENEAVKKALESQLTVLKDNFENQGLKVESIEITIASHGFEQNHNLDGENSDENQNQSKHKKGLDLSSLEDLSDDELSQQEKDVMNMVHNSSVEYTA